MRCDVTLLTVAAVWCLPLQLFLAQFMNTGLVTLLVNAHLPNIAVKIGSTGLFLVRVCGLCLQQGWAAHMHPCLTTLLYCVLRSVLVAGSIQ